MSYHCPMCDWKDPSKQPVCPKCGHPTVEDEKNPRAWTQKEVQDKFLHHCWAMVKYWDQDSRKPDARGKLEGLMHSFLTLLDGCAMGFPALDVIPHPHGEDKSYHVDQGENYFEPFELPPGVVTVHGGDMLNDMMYDWGRKHGYLK